MKENWSIIPTSLSMTVDWTDAPKDVYSILYAF